MFLFRFLARFYNYYFSDERGLAHQVKELTGFAPARLGLFSRAFAHKSGASRGGGEANNERLEYLGDAVLGTIVAEYLFKKYPTADEGFLTKMRSKIVKRQSLNDIGERMGRSDILRERNRMKLSSSMLGNAVEALVGAVYLESGYARTERFVIWRMLRPYVDVHELETNDDNYKSQLLEACQKQGKSIAYKLVKKFKQDRRDRFQVAVVIAGQEVAIADDFNKKSAEQLASLKALEQMGLADNLTVPRRKEKVSRAAKRAAREKKSAAPPAVTTKEPKRRRGGAVIVEEADRGPHVERLTPKPTTVAEAGADQSSKRKAKRQRGPHDFLVKHGVRTGVAGAAAVAAVLGEAPRTSAAPPRATSVAPKQAPASPSVVPAAKPKRRRVSPTIRHAILGGGTGVAVVEGILGPRSVNTSAAAPGPVSRPSTAKPKPEKPPKRKRRVSTIVKHATAVGVAGVSLLEGTSSARAATNSRAVANRQSTPPSGPPITPTRTANAAAPLAEGAPTAGLSTAGPKPKRRRGAVAKRTLTRMLKDGAAGVAVASETLGS